MCMKVEISIIYKSACICDSVKDDVPTCFYDERYICIIKSHCFSEIRKVMCKFLKAGDAHDIFAVLYCSASVPRIHTDTRDKE